MQLYKRTYGAVDYLVDIDGKLVTDDTVYVEVGASGNPNACVLALCSVNQELSDIIAAWGKTPAVFSSQELGTTDYTITIGSDFVNIVGEVITPEIENYPLEPNLYKRTSDNHVILVDEYGRALGQPNSVMITDGQNLTLRDNVPLPSGWEISPVEFNPAGSTNYAGFTLYISAGSGSITPEPSDYPE